jgi:hypothetical protein
MLICQVFLYNDFKDAIYLQLLIKNASGELYNVLIAILSHSWDAGGRSTFLNKGNQHPNLSSNVLKIF